MRVSRCKNQNAYEKSQTDLLPFLPFRGPLWCAAAKLFEIHDYHQPEKPADVYYKRRVAASYFWGIVNKPQAVVDTACGSAGLSDVKFTTNFGYSLLHVVTLGMVNVVRVEWKCQKEAPVIGQQP